MKSAHLILKDNGQAFLYSNSLTKVNLWISSKPYLRLNWKELTPNEKLKFINEALDNSKTGIEKPTSFKDVGKELLGAYGFSTWNELFKKAKLCYIDLENELYIFTPSIYDSRTGGHEGVKEGIAKMPVDAAPEEIFATLEKVMERSL
jgi:hypothetical protein